MIQLSPNEITDTQNIEYYDPINTTATSSKGYVIDKYQVNVPQTTVHYEPIKTKLTECAHKKEKIGFWQTIFGDKKCKICSQKKKNCLCTIRKKGKNVRSDIDVKTVCTEETRPFNCSVYGTTQEVKKSGSCPVKCSQPTAQRGFGVHLYFCVDGKRQNKEIKKKRSLSFNNENIGVYTDLNRFDGCIQNDTLHKEPTKVEIVNYVSKVKINADHIDVVDIPASREIKNENNSKTEKPLKSPTAKFTKVDADDNTNSRVNSYQHPLLAMQHSEDVYHVQDEEKSIFSIYEPIDNKQKDITAESVSYDYNFNTRKEQCLPCTSSQKNGAWNIKEQDKHLEEEFKIGSPGILRNTLDQVNHIETIVLPVKTTSNTLPSTEETLVTKNKHINLPEVVPDISNKMSVSTEKFRKTSSKTRIFVRNSLLSIRRERKQSAIQDRISLILEKLNNIEDKIGELEKNTEDNSNDITISCTNNKSTVAIAFNKQEVENKPNENTTATANPIRNKIRSTIKIKSVNEKIYLNGTKDVAVVKQRKKSIRNVPKSFICHNPYELDAHAIASKSYSIPKTFQCNNPKIVIECPKKNQRLKSPIFCDKWRRISEELKISQPDVTVKR